MLVFDLPGRPNFARDTETGEIFAIRSTKEIDTVRAIRIVDGIERSVSLQVKAELEDPAIEIYCTSFLFDNKPGLPPWDTASIRRLIVAIIEIQKRDPLLVGPFTLRSDFERFKTWCRSRGSEPAFELPSDAELAEMLQSS